MDVKTTVAQLTPIFGQARARDIVSVAAALNLLIAESPLAQLEDHMLLPGMAAVLGAALGHGRAVKMERRLKAAAGSNLWPSLLEPDEIVEIFKATDVPPDQGAEELATKLLARMLGLQSDEDAFADLDAEVKG